MPCPGRRLQMSLSKPVRRIDHVQLPLPMDPNNQQEEYQEHQDFYAHPIQKQRVGFWEKIGGGSLSIAILVHIILGIAGLLIIFKYASPPEKTVDFMPPGGGGGGGGERGMEYEVKKKKQTQITPSTNVKRVFAQGASSNFAIPDPGESFGEMSTLSAITGGGMSGGLGGAGNGSGFGGGKGGGRGNGNGFGFGGAGGGKLFGLIPEQMRKRCSAEDRLQRLKENGGTPECETAVLKGLQFLKASQNSDGSWGDSRKVANTGLALLAYFGHCETPISEEFGDSCLRGIVYLVNVGLKDTAGRMATEYASQSWCYEHAIATYALGEATTFCRDLKITDVPKLEEVTQKAGDYIIANQNASGGWAYSYERSEGHSDVSVTGWHVQALKACEHSGMRFNGMSGSIQSALRYIDKCQDDKGGGYGYNGTAPAGDMTYYSLTGVGMLCNQMWDKGGKNGVRKAAKYLVANSKFEYNGANCDLYGHYYESQAMMQSGGDDWKFYNAMFRDQLLKNQDENGMWKSPGGNNKIVGVGVSYTGDGPDAKVYRTSLCTLMLEVYYRFLSTGGGGSSSGSRPRI